MRKSFWFMFSIITLVGITGLLTMPNPCPDDPVQIEGQLRVSVPHALISVLGNSDLGAFPGSGTPGDPVRMENLEIDVNFTEDIGDMISSTSAIYITPIFPQPSLLINFK